MIKTKKLSDLEFSNRLINEADFLFEEVAPTPLKNPKLIHYNEELLNQIEISVEEIKKKSTLDFLNGNLEFEGIHFHASYYAGHQFGHFVPRLGDGRAMMMGEIKNSENQFFELQLKGSGLTPFSRMGDGKAVLRSSIREYLASAHMHALNIPTTLALSLVEGTDPVYREVVENAAIVLRVSESFLRFGHFEFLYFHKKHDELLKLIEFSITRYFSEFADHPNRYHLFFQEITKRTAKLMAHWQSVGFCHGVMNTDNMSLLGLTIDYGPFGFIDSFDLDHICNQSDHEGRYSFGNQPPIGLWNLEKLAICLSPFINEESSKLVLSTYEKIFNVEYHRLLRAKLGLMKIHETDEQFFRSMLNMLVTTKQDYTNFFRQLSHYKKGERVIDGVPEVLLNFLNSYDDRLAFENSNDVERSHYMLRINPKFILRNYLSQMCIEDNSLIDNMFKVMTNPFDEWSEFEDWSKPAPPKYQAICVSCSS